MFADLLLMSRGFTSAITRLVSRSRAYQSLLTLPYVGSTVASSLLLYTSCTECFRHDKLSYLWKFWEIRISPPVKGFRISFRLAIARLSSMSWLESTCCMKTAVSKQSEGNMLKAVVNLVEMALLPTLSLQLLGYQIHVETIPHTSSATCSWFIKCQLVKPSGKSPRISHPSKGLNKVEETCYHEATMLTNTPKSGGVCVSDR